MCIPSQTNKSENDQVDQLVKNTIQLSSIFEPIAKDVINYIKKLFSEIAKTHGLKR